MQDSSADQAQPGIDLSDEKLRNLIDPMKDYGVCTLDLPGTILSWNPGAEWNTCYPPSEIVGLPFKKLFVQDVDDEVPQKALAEAKRVGYWVGAHWCNRKNGERFLGAVSITSMRDAKGELQGFAAVLYDLTKSRLQAEQILEMGESIRSERDRLRGATEASMDALYICESVRDETGELVDFTFVYLNRNVEKMLGIPLDRLLGTRMCEASLTTNSDGLFQRYRDVVETGVPLDYEFTRTAGHSGVGEWIRLQAVKLGDGIVISAGDVSARKFSEAKNVQLTELMREERDRFRSVAETSMDGLFICEAVRDTTGEIVDFRFTYLNRNAEKMINLSPAVLDGGLLCEVLPFVRRDGLFQRYCDVVRSGLPLEYEFHVDDPRVLGKWIRVQAVKLADGIVVTASDITLPKANEDSLVRLADSMRAIMASSPFAMIVTDSDGIITRINPAAEHMLWYSPEELVGIQTPLVMLDPQEVTQRAIVLSDELGIAVKPGLEVLSVKPRRGLLEEAEWRLKRRDGSHVDVQLTISALLGTEGQMVGLILLAYDITERKKTQDYITHLAHHDSLTQLPTRALLHDRLTVAITRAARFGKKVAVLMLDLDNFKKVNDSAGHHAGDELLRVVANRLQKTLRQSDTVARMGGDEFVVVLEDLHGDGQAIEVARKLVAAVGTPFLFAGRTISATASVGLSIYPDNGESAETLLRNADAAMYAIKDSGRNGHQLYTPELEAYMVRKRQLESELNDALANDEFELHCQPQICLKTGVVTGVEALIRWNSPEHGLVMPSEFISIAEESGLIVPIGNWVLRKACEQGRQLQLQLGRALTIAVNISSVQFQQNGFSAAVKEALREFELPPSSLEMEFKENTLVGSSPRQKAVFDELRTMGVRVAIDDFGTGFSNMAYILRFHVDRLKIDQSFVRGMDVNPESWIVTNAVIAFAKSLGIAVTAEGVETAQQRSVLLTQDCNDAQGFFYSKAVPMEALPSAIEAIERMG